MFQEWTQSTTVHRGGKIELVLPALTEGEQVEVTIRKKEPKATKQVIKALEELKALSVSGANISDESLRRQNLYPDRS